MIKLNLNKKLIKLDLNEKLIKLDLNEKLIKLDLNEKLLLSHKRITSGFFNILVYIRAANPLYNKGYFFLVLKAYEYFSFFPIELLGLYR